MTAKKKNKGEYPRGNYQLSRYNATRHGILSKEILLPWENPKDHEVLYRSLIQEYAPAGSTEEHLVEEIAGIIWRKRRLRQAETSVLRKRYSKLVTNSSCEIAESGLLGKQRLEGGFSGIWGDELWVKEIFHMSAEEVTHELNLCKREQQLIKKALQILQTKSPNAYEQALKTLSPDIRDDWETELEDNDDENDPTPERLKRFLFDASIRFDKYVAVYSNYSRIMDQARGESIDPEMLDKLSRYEIFLDRKMEKTLSVLLKLQALRREREKVEQLIE